MKPKLFEATLGGGRLLKRECRDLRAGCAPKIRTDTASLRCFRLTKGARALFPRQVECSEVVEAILELHPKLMGFFQTRRRVSAAIHRE
jgi:hypothetical protein